MTNTKKKKARSVAKKAGVSYAGAINILNKAKSEKSLIDRILSETELAKLFVLDDIEHISLRAECDEPKGLYLRKTKDFVYERAGPYSFKHVLTPSSQWKIQPASYEEYLMWHIKHAVEQHRRGSEKISQIEYKENNYTFTTVLCKDKRYASENLPQTNLKLDIKYYIETELLSINEIILLTDAEYLGVLSYNNSTDDYVACVFRTDNVRYFDLNDKPIDSFKNTMATLSDVKNDIFDDKGDLKSLELSDALKTLAKYAKILEESAPKGINKPTKWYDHEDELIKKVKRVSKNNFVFDPTEIEISKFVDFAINNTKDQIRKNVECKTVQSGIVESKMCVDQWGNVVTTFLVPTYFAKRFEEDSELYKPELIGENHYLLYGADVYLTDLVPKDSIIAIAYDFFKSVEQQPLTTYKSFDTETYRSKQKETLSHCVSFVTIKYSEKTKEERLINQIGALEKRIEDTFDKAQENPKSTKFDYALMAQYETHINALEKLDKIMILNKLNKLFKNSDVKGVCMDITDFNELLSKENGKFLVPVTKELLQFGLYGYFLYETDDGKTEYKSIYVSRVLSSIRGLNYGPIPLFKSVINDLKQATSTHEVGSIILAQLDTIPEINGTLLYKKCILEFRKDLAKEKAESTGWDVFPSEDESLGIGKFTAIRINKYGDEEEQTFTYPLK